MFYTSFIDGNGKPQTNLYHGFSRWFEDSFSPDTEVKSIIDFTIHGRTYTEKKECLRNIAIDFQCANSEANGGLSYGEIADISSWFEKNGKRYGLIKEFHENAIC